MVLSLVCTAPHPLIPALEPGNRIQAELGPVAPSVTCPATPRVLRRILGALRDGALVIELPPDLNAIQSDVEARWLAVTADLERRAVASILRRSQAG